MAIEINGTTGISGVDGSATTPALQGSDSNTGISFGTDEVEINTGGTERVKVDSSGRLLAGTSSVVGTSSDASYYALLTIKGAATSPSIQGQLALVRGENTTDIASGETIGKFTFADSDAGNYGEISCVADGTTGSSDYPGRIAFSTTADGASSPTERMRITSAGYVTSKSSNIGSITGTGWTLNSATGELVLTKSQSTPLYINRIGNDGVLIAFYQDGTLEGNIQVNGSSVTLAGGHLSRWSQLPGVAERTEILRGSVLSNLDEMCEWGEEDNEQLNRMQVSTVEGDPNVAGVFQSWDDEDDIYTNDFYCAMTGDFVIRIAQGTTVARGDLLMSAGDGTAKPQDDDIVRSKTIAKVTSTNVSCTYDDGSYCVPCVLMAC